MKGNYLLKLPNSLKKAIEERSHATHTPESRVIREALYHFLDVQDHEFPSKKHDGLTAQQRQNQKRKEQRSKIKELIKQDPTIITKALERKP